MYVAELFFAKKSPRPQRPDLAINRLLNNWRNNGQVISREWPVIEARGGYRLWVLIPARDALTWGHSNRFCRDATLALKKENLGPPRVRILGKDPDSMGEDRCRKRSSFVLYTTSLSMESPLRCGECFRPVPLYRIPPTDKAGHRDHIRFWEWTYQQCDALFMGSGVGERFGYREISDSRSSLTRNGLDVCSRIRKATGISCYYYLYRYYSSRRERNRRCPGCNSQWLLKEPWLGKFEFRCDRCLLVSNSSFAE